MKNLLYGSASAFFIMATLAIIIMLSRDSKMVTTVRYNECMSTELRVDSLPEAFNRLFEADSIISARERIWRQNKGYRY